MTEFEAKNLKPGDMIRYHGENCEVIHIHKKPVLIECKSAGSQRGSWHLVRPGVCRMPPSEASV